METEGDVDTDDDAISVAIAADQTEVGGAVEKVGPTRYDYNAVTASTNGVKSAPMMNGDREKHGESAVVVSAVSVRRLVAAGLSAIKANAIPGAVLLTAALILVLLYYNSAGVQSAFNAVASVKDQYSFLFSAITTAIAGGLIPAIVIAVRESFGAPSLLPRIPSLTVESIFLTLFWAYKGVEVDAFYQLQGVIFGNGNDAGTVAAKVAVDQFVYNPVWATHSVLIGYLLKDNNFNFQRTYEAVMTMEYIAFIFPTTLFSVWMVWIPCTSLIYCLPSPLQIPLFNFALAFWALIMQLLAKNKQRDDAHDTTLVVLKDHSEVSDETRAALNDDADDDEHEDDDDVDDDGNSEGEYESGDEATG